jgi:hypothetical protein
MRTRSLVCKNRKHTSVVTTGSPNTAGIPRANGFTAYFVLSPVIGLCCHRRKPQCISIAAYLMPASRHQDHTASPSAFAPFVKGASNGHRIPRPTLVTIAKRPSWRARDAREDAGDLPDITSEIFCDRLARRANQFVIPEAAPLLSGIHLSRLTVIPGRCVSIEPGIHNAARMLGEMDSQVRNCAP